MEVVADLAVARAAVAEVAGRLAVLVVVAPEVRLVIRHSCGLECRHSKSFQNRLNNYSPLSNSGTHR